MLVAAGIAFYENGKDDSNIFITAAAIAVFMFLMMKLSAKTPSKNQDDDEI
jgi:hypothetical protein